MAEAGLPSVVSYTWTGVAAPAGTPADIIAKVHRDRLMAQLDGEYPGYGFADHKGYPTPEHLDALERLGACVLHRRSFAPVAKKLGLIPVQQDLFATPKKRAGEAR